VVPREALLNEVWGNEYTGTERVLDVRLADLRRKMRGWSGRIEAVRGIGYRLVVGEMSPVGD
jgi:DNA-binding response OmpR family regulator